MSNRSIKDSMSEAAFAFVKQGFEDPNKSNLPAMPKPEEKKQNGQPVEKKPSAPKQTRPQKKKDSAPRTGESKSVNRLADHLVSVSTRMPSSLFSDLKKEALTRQLANQTPHSLQQILIDAANDWLKRNSH